MIIGAKMNAYGKLVLRNIRDRQKDIQVRNRFVQEQAIKGKKTRELDRWIKLRMIIGKGGGKEKHGIKVLSSMQISH